MSIFDWFNPHNDFQALGPNGQPINSVGQSGFQAQAMGGMGAANPMLGNAQANYGQQGDYINMLQGQAMGQGPSVAQNLLQQQTDANNRGAASAVASQRGMNPGMAQKLILDQQAQQNQQAAGQGSLLRAQEMMSARGMLGSALGQQAQSNLGAGGMALGQQGQQLGNYWNAQNLNSQTAMGNAQLQNQGLGINAGVAQQNAQTGGALFGGLMNGLGGAMSMATSGGMFKGATGAAGTPAMGGLPPVGDAIGFSHGGDIPGHAVARGDSPQNDKVPALLSPHEIVLPRSITLAEDAPERARDFVRAIKGRKPEHREGPWKMDKGGEVPALPAQSKGEQVKVNPGQPKEDPQAFRRVLMGVQSPGQTQPPARMADGGDVPDPATDPGSFGPSSTTASFFGGQTSMTNPQQASGQPAATPPPDMLAAPAPDSIAAPGQSFTDTLGGPLGTMESRGPSFDFKPPKEKPFVPGAEMLGGEKEELAGIKGEASARENLGSTLKAAADQHQKDIAGVNAKYDAQIASAQSGASTAQSWLNDPKNAANPDRFWGERLTGQRISASIGMILGGIGSGLTGGPNHAVEIINKAIDRDVEAQKINIGVKENQVSRYLQQGMSLEASKEHALADAKDMAAARIDSASAAYVGTAAQAQAQIESGKLRQDAYMHRLQGIAMARQNDIAEMQKRFMQQVMTQTGGNPAKAMLEMSFWQKPESMAAHTVGVDEEVPTGAKDSTGKPVMQTKTTPYLANSPEARQKTADSMVTYRTMDKALRDIESFSKANPLGGTPGSEEVGDAQAAAMHLKMGYEAYMAHMNRAPSPEVLKHIDDIVADPTAFFKTNKTGGKLKFVRRMINELKQSTLDSNTLGPQ